MAKSPSPTSRVKPQKFRRLEAADARFHEMDLNGSPPKLAASLYSDRQAAKSTSQLRTLERTHYGRKCRGAHQQKSVNVAAHALLDAGSPENGFLVAAKKPANSRQGAISQFETAPSNEILRANTVAAEPLQLRHNLFTSPSCLEMGQPVMAFKPL
jgi:hypothetical protein